MTRTRWIIFALACALLLGVLVVNSKKDDVDVSQLNPGTLITEGDATDHVYGNKNAKVVIYEYGDFQCPGCGGAHPQLKTIKEKYKDQIAFVFRNLPLTSIHPNALAAATVAGAAAQQGKFWEMHDKLYENQSAWENLSASQRGDVFVDYAQQLGLNVDQFKTDLTSRAVSNKISTDRALAAKVKAEATPTILIGDEKMPSDVINNLVQQDGKLLSERIEAAIKASGGTLPASE